MQYKIRDYREQSGMTQQALAEKAGISRAILSGLESGTIEVTTTKTLLKIAEALNVRVSNLFFEENV